METNTNKEDLRTKQVKWTGVEQVQVMNAMQKRLPSQSKKSVFEELAKVMEHKTYNQISTYYYGAVRVKKKKTPADNIILTKKPRNIKVTEELFNILTQEQKDTLLKNLLGI